jgi:hypothetical protein
VGASPASEKGRQDKEPGAKGLVTAGTVRRNEGVHDMRTTTSRRRRSTFVPQTTVVPGLRQPAAQNPARVTEEEVAKNFAEVVTRFSKDDLAAVSGRTPEAAKHWKAASRAPNSSSLINMARQLPIVRDWLISEIDVDLPAGENPADTVNTVITGLQLAANLPGQEGVMARMLLSKLQGGG